MRWNRFRLKTKTEAEELVIYALSEAGVEGVEVEDHIPLTDEDLSRMFVDIPPSFGEDDGTAYLSFYLDEKEDPAPVMERIREEIDNIRPFTDVGECSIEISTTEDADWMNNWKKYFTQFYVDDILIVPSWEEVRPGDEDKMVLHIDPGSAFGTGMHETTQLCLKALKEQVKDGDEVLDVGTGSGILSIAALKLGARHATATDLDPGAVGAVSDNLEANGLSVENAHTPDELRACSPQERSALVLRVDAVLSAYPAVTVTQNQSVRFRNGGALDLARVRCADTDAVLYRVYNPQGTFLGLGARNNEKNELAVRRLLIER